VTKSVSIVTPSFNQSEFLEFCLRSISAERAQGHVEHLVLDGGSTDASLSILDRFSDVIDYRRSGPDRGQSSAINAGMARATGDILCWINSDDGLAPGAVQAMRDAIGDARGPAWGIGCCDHIDEDGRRFKTWRPSRHDELDYVLDWRRNYILQPAVFWNRQMWELAGPLEESLHYAMDFDLWLRFFQIRKPVLSDKPIGMHRSHGRSKTSLVGCRIYDEYLWALDKRLVTDPRRRKLGRSHVRHALCHWANSEVFHRNNERAREAMRKALSLSVLAAADSSFMKAAAKLAFGTLRSGAG